MQIRIICSDATEKDKAIQALSTAFTIKSISPYPSKYGNKMRYYIDAELKPAQEEEP